MKIQPDSYGKLIGLGFLVMLIAFPVVMLYTLEEANKSEMAKHTNEISKVMNRLRSYYATAVVGKVIGSDEKIVASENHRGISNAIPIPATFSIEMGEIFGYSHNDTELRYNFTSDYPFLNRERTELDEFQKKALESFRANRELKEYREIKSSWIGNSSHRMATPVFMEPACVACHNNHPAATKTNWIEGDIRGIQEVSVSSIEVNPANYSYLIIYFLALASFAAMSMNVFRLAANRLKRANGEIQLAKDKEHETALKLEAKVRELALLAAVANKSTFGVTIADCKEPDRPLIYANEAFYKMTGMKPEDVIGRNCRFLSGEQTSKEARSELRNAIDRGLSCTVDILNYRADGHTFWNRLTVFPVGGSDRNPDYYVRYQVDVTKTKKMEEERELLSQEIQDSKKHESLGVMVAGVAHEINNPLGIALTATSHMIREANRLRLDLNTGDDKSSHKIADYLEDESEAFSLIQSNLERATKLVRDFKGISADRVDVSRRKINLWQYTETLISSYLPTMKRSKVSIELTGTKQIESTLDTGAFGQVIANIITNSVTHAFANTADKKITVSLTEKDWKAEIEISDNGSGIPEGILHKIFDPFVTTKRGSGGTGLGLYIAKRIVNNELNGELHAFNKPEGGAVFRISFPLREVL